MVRGAVPLVLREVGLGQALAERRDVDLLAGQGDGEGVVDALHLDELDVVLGQAGLAQHVEHERALGLARAVGDLLALEVLDRLARRRRVRRRARRSGAPRGRRVSRAATMRTSVPVQCAKSGGMSATEPMSIASARKASSVLGPPVMLAHSTSTSRSSIRPDGLEGDLRGRVADAQHGAVGGLVGERGGQLELGPGLVAAAAGEATRPAAVSRAARIRGRRIGRGRGPRRDIGDSPSWGVELIQSNVSDST